MISLIAGWKGLLQCYCRGARFESPRFHGIVSHVSFSWVGVMLCFGLCSFYLWFFVMCVLRRGSFSQIGTPSTISRKAHLHIRFALIVLLYDSSSIKELCCVTLIFLFQSFILFHFLSQSVSDSRFSEFSFSLLFFLTDMAEEQNKTSSSSTQT